MKTMHRICIAAAILMLSQLSLTAQPSGASVTEEDILQNEQALEHEQESMIEEEAEPVDEESLEMEEQNAELEDELMVEEEAEPLDETSSEELEQDVQMEENIPAE